MTARNAVMADYIGGLKSQHRIIMALFFREVRTRFGDRRLGIFWGIVEPMLHVGGFCLLGLIFGRIGPYSIPFVPFLISGVFPFILMRNCYKRVIRAVGANQALLVFPQITFLDMSLARVLLEYMITTTAMILAMGAYAWFVEPLDIDSLPQAVMAYSFFAVLGLALGMFCRPLIAIIPNMDTFMSFFMRFCYLTSGIFFSLDRIPDQYMAYVKWNPFARLLDILRDGIFTRYRPQDGFESWWYVLFIAAALFVFSRALERRFSIYSEGESDD